MQEHIAVEDVEGGPEGLREGRRGRGRTAVVGHAAVATALAVFELEKFN